MMAEALTDIPAIPRIDKLENVNTRRHSTGKAILPNGGLTVISRYLRASQGSCHDICKYGTGFTLETESKSRRCPMPKIVVPKRGAGRNPERTSEGNVRGRTSEGNVGERTKKSEISLKLFPDFKIQEPDGPVVVKIAQTQGGHRVGSVEEDLTDTMKCKISVKPSDDAEPQKPEYLVVSLKPSPEDPVDIIAMAAEGEAQDEENAETTLSSGEKNLEVCVKLSPDSESEKPVDPDCIESEVSSWTNKESVSPEQVFLPTKETDFAVAHAKDLKLKPRSKPSSLLRQACSSGNPNFEGRERNEANILLMTSLGVSRGRNKGETTITKGIRTSVIGDKKNVVPPSTSLSPKKSDTGVSSTNARKKKPRGVYHSKNQETAKQTKPENLRVKNAKGSDNLKGVSHLMDRENVMKPNSEQAEFANIPEKALYLIESNPEGKPAQYIRNNVSSVMPFSSSKDKSMKYDKNRIPIGRPPLACEKKRTIYRPKVNQASGSPPSLSSRLRSTRTGLNVSLPSLTSLSLSASSKSSHSDTSSELDKAGAQKQKSSLKTMYKGRPKRALIVTSKDKQLGDEKSNFQRGKVMGVPIENCTPRRLTFKRRAHVDNRNDDNQKGKVEDSTPRRLKFRRRVLVDNRNGDNPNGRGEEFTPRRLKFRRRVLLDNRNADDQIGRGEDYTPRKLKFCQRVLDENKIGFIQNSKVGTSKNNSGGKEPDVGQDKETEVRSKKISLRHNDVEGKKDSGTLYNNIIEQTASRLVRTKRSKVKALVSAFESVISHLDTSFSETNNIH